MLFNHHHNLIKPLFTNAFDAANLLPQLTKINRRSFCILHDVVVVVREEVLHFFTSFSSTLLYPGCIHMLGYRRTPIGSLEIIPEEAVIVRRMPEKASNTQII